MVLMSNINEISNRTIIRILAIIGLFIGVVWIALGIRRELIWIVTAAFLVVALNPLVDKVEHWLPKKNHKRNRSLAAIITMIGLAITLVGLAYVALPPLVSQTHSLVRDLPNEIAKAEKTPGALHDLVVRYNLADKVKSFEAAASHKLVNSSGDILRTTFTSFAATASIFFLTLFGLIEGPKWVRRFWYLHPKKNEAHRQELAAQMYDAIAKYVTGNLVISLITAIAVTLFMFIIGAPFAIPMGLLLGLFRLIPVVGGLIGSAVIILVSLLNSPTTGLIMLVFLLIYFQVENHILTPVILGRSVSLSPLTVLLSAIIGVAVAGFIGALLAVPAASIAQILVKDYFQNHASYEK